MEFIDTHCHIYYDKYQDDIEDVINRANNNNVNHMICVGVDLGSSEKSLLLSEKYKSVFATAGYHPHESKFVFPRYHTSFFGFQNLHEKSTWKFPELHEKSTRKQ